MSALWLNRERPICIHPVGSLLRGKVAIVYSWAQNFAGADPPRIEQRLIDTFTAADLIVRLVEESIRPTGSSDQEASRVIAANVFQRLDGI